MDFSCILVIANIVYIEAKLTFHTWAPCICFIVLSYCQIVPATGSNIDNYFVSEAFYQSWGPTCPSWLLFVTFFGIFLVSAPHVNPPAIG